VDAAVRHVLWCLVLQTSMDRATHVCRVHVQVVTLRGTLRTAADVGHVCVCVCRWPRMHCFCVMCRRKCPIKSTLRRFANHDIRAKEQSKKALSSRKERERGGRKGDEGWCIAKYGGGYMQRGVAKGLKVPCLFMITEVSIRCQKNPEVGIRRR